ncbi:MAG: RodZ domain-containing protein [Pseudomonadales bacterium]
MNGSVVLPLHEYSLPYQKTAGILLREARELKGLSQESVASTLNLMVSHVVGMESDSYNPHIEGKHFAAYLKSYARLVDLNPQILLGLYQGSSLASQSSSSYLQTHTVEKRSGGNGFSLRLLTIFALMSVALIFTRQGIEPRQLAVQLQSWAIEIGVTVAASSAEFFSSNSGIATAIADERAQEAIGIDVPADEHSNVKPVDLPRWSRPAWTKPANDSAPAKVHTEQVASTLATSPGSALSLHQGTGASIETIADSDKAAGTVTVTPSDATYQAYRLDISSQGANSEFIGEDVLQFTFNGNCWIEVYDSHQNPIIMETKLEGELLRISGEAPFEVRVGNSRAVSLMLNGQPVHIEQHPTIDSTELIVGQR